MESEKRDETPTTEREEKEDTQRLDKGSGRGMPLLNSCYASCWHRDLQPMRHYKDDCGTGKPPLPERRTF